MTLTPNCTALEGWGARSHSFDLACPWFVPVSHCLCSFSLACSQFVVGCPCHASPSSTCTQPHPHALPLLRCACLHLLIVVHTPLRPIAFELEWAQFCLVAIVHVSAHYPCSLVFVVCALCTLVHVHLLVCSVCSTLPVKAILVFFKSKLYLLYLPLHLRLKILIKQMNS